MVEKRLSLSPSKKNIKPKSLNQSGVRGSKVFSNLKKPPPINPADLDLEPDEPIDLQAQLKFEMQEKIGELVKQSQKSETNQRIASAYVVSSPKKKSKKPVINKGTLMNLQLPKIEEDVNGGEEETKRGE